MMLSPVAPPSSLSATDRPGDMLDTGPCPGSTTMPCASIADFSSLQGAPKDDCRGNPLLHGVSRRQHLTYIIFGRPTASSSCAIHTQSCTSVFRPGTCLICAALTS